MKVKVQTSIKLWSQLQVELNEIFSFSWGFSHTNKQTVVVFGHKDDAWDLWAKISQQTNTDKGVVQPNFDGAQMDTNVHNIL